ncbi:MAG: IscS subfamily cysteine desulfurase [Planctomycetes bacterium]|nr:IscS subfamily cysteine desulfurase [Planctomycetota bacterium]
MARIYLDHHATTPCDPRVVEAMLPFFTQKFGNAASRTHAFGKEADRACEAARRQVADLIRADPSEIVFTSGATESNNLAIKGAVDFRQTGGKHLVTVATEHPSVLDPCRALEREGRARVTVLPVKPDGLLDLDELRRAITEDTVLVSVMFANNEIGVLQSVAEIGRLCHEKGVLFHCDAAQACGKVEVDVQAMDIDLLSITAHKLYGPKGIGALYVRKRHPRVRLAAQLDGGGHENGLRSGTLPVPLVVGFGQACEIAGREMRDEAVRVLALRERLRKHIVGEFDHVRVNGSLERRLPGNLNVSFEYVEGESLILGMADVAVSSGSACASAKLEPSHVLLALGVNEALARSSIRFGLGRSTTEAEIDEAWKLLKREVLRLREISPLYSLARPGVRR